MNVAKGITTVFLAILYVCCFGTLSFGVEFPDKTKVKFSGWLF